MKHHYLRVLPLLILLIDISCINGQPNQGKSSINVASNSVMQNNSSAAAESADMNDTGTAKHATKYTNPKIQVFLETSGSMNGYVNGGTSIFQQVIKEFLSGINNSGYPTEVSYNYITSKITPQSTDLDRYITNLTPSSFASNGNVATTDIGGIFKQVLSLTEPNTVSILISDCIISPGSNVDTQAYLRGQMTDVRDAIIGYTNQYQDLACLVYQFDSNFNGRYFDFQNKGRTINQSRPFYIWVFGNTLHVAMLKLKYVPDRDFRVAPIRNQWMIFNTELSYFQPEFQYGLMLPTSPNFGKYKRVDKTVVSSIQKSTPDSNYKFSFGAKIEAAVYLMGEEYVNDPKNYTVILNKLSKQEYTGKIESDANGTSPYSSIFSVESEQPFNRGNFTLAFTPKVPNWAISCTDDDDRSFNGINDNKTYGLDAIFYGIYNGYNSGMNDNIIANFDFEIK